MGNYVHIRGTAQIKPEYVEVFRQRFSWGADGWPMVGWGDFPVPPEIEALPQYRELACHHYTKLVPGHQACASFGFEKSFSRLSEEEADALYAQDNDGPKAVMDYSESGRLVFEASVKSYRDILMFAFILLIAQIAVEWVIEYDDAQDHYCDNPEEHHYRFTSIDWSKLSFIEEKFTEWQSSWTATTDERYAKYLQEKKCLKLLQSSLK